VDADRLILATRSALATDSDLISLEEHSSINSLIEKLLQTIPTQDHVLIESLTAELSKETENLAAQRMNRGIRVALSGKLIESL